MGKGSKRRPLLVDKETYDSNWDAVFGRKTNSITDEGRRTAVMKKDDGTSVTTKGEKT